MDPLPVLTEGPRTNIVTTTKDQPKERLLRALHPTARLKQQTLEKSTRVTHDLPALQAGPNRKVREWVAKADHSETARPSSQSQSGSEEDLEGREASRAPSLPLSKYFLSVWQSSGTYQAVRV